MQGDPTHHLMQRTEILAEKDQLALDDPSLGAILFVQRIEDGQVTDINDMVAMNTEIQNVTEQQFVSIVAT
jgi:hypothetical protein